MLYAWILGESCGCRSHVTKDSGLPGCYVRTSVSDLDVSKEPAAFTLKVSFAAAWTGQPATRSQIQNT